MTKYNDSGNLQWTRQFGTTDGEGAFGVATDGLGNVFVSGGTLSSLFGPNPNEGNSSDAFIAKYNAAGDLQWGRQFGARFIDQGNALSTDGLGNVYVAGQESRGLPGANPANRYDAFVAKYNAAGDLQWHRLFGTTVLFDWAEGVSADGFGNVYVAGNTNGSLGGPYAGPFDDSTVGDAFVAKYDAAGSQLWIRQLGTTAIDWASDVSADGRGNVYITGYTRGSLAGPHAGGRSDVFVAKYDATGELLWTPQFGTPGDDGGDFRLGKVVADGLGNVYVSGSTGGSLGGPNAGGYDAFLVKFVDPAVANLPGDFNRDGAVDGADFLAWQQGLGAAYDAADLNAWRAHFGAPARGAAAGAPASSHVPVPEPSMLALAAPALALLAAARNRCRVSPKLAAILGENRQRLGRFSETADPRRLSDAARRAA